MAKYGGAKLSTGAKVNHAWAQIGDIVSGKPGHQRDLALARQEQAEKSAMFRVIETGLVVETGHVTHSDRF